MRGPFFALSSAITASIPKLSSCNGRYTLPTIAFHWFLALLITGSFVFGLYMVDLPFSPARLKQYNWHKWAGITILTLSALRLLWRLGHRPPIPDSRTPTWQVKIAQATHAMLYALFFAAPLAGWAYSSAAGFPVVYLGLFQLPDWVAHGPELAASLKLTHRVLTYSLAALGVLHVAAALKHPWMDRDRLLARMNPF